MAPSSKKRRLGDPLVKKANSLQWVFEPFESNPDFFQKSMFGCLAGYIADRMVLVAADGDEPWNGILIPTERDCHAMICKQFPNLKPHSVLGKWLYLSQNDKDFEETVSAVQSLIARNDSRFGIVPKPKKKGLRPSKK